jgi:sec-independent protein translocase protein TatA
VNLALTRKRRSGCYFRLIGTGLLSPWHVAIFLLVVMLVYGPKRLPELGRSLGKGIRELKDGIAHHQEPDADEAPSALPPAGPRDRDAI